MRFTVLAFLLAGVAVVGCEPPEDKKDPIIRAAWIYHSAIGDAGWTHAHNQGRLEVESELDYVETAYKENVPEGGGARDDLQIFADEGYDIIFSTSYGYMDSTLEAANENPEVYFEHCSGWKDAPNMVHFFGRMYQARYLSGIVAGLATTTNKMGYVAAFPIPEVIRGINAFALGVHSVNPGAEIYVEWTNTWYDPTVEGNTATALLANNVDVMAQHQDSTAAVLVARDAGIKAIGYDADMSVYAPDTVLTSPVWHWGPYYIRRIKAVKEDSWTKENYWGGIEDGIFGLAPYNSHVEQSTQDRVESARQSLLDGSLKVFSGPINKQDGSQWVAQGESLTDEQLLSMDDFVEDVVGTID